MKLFINADDFGWDESCSKAIVDAFNKQYITTTTACGNGDYLEQAMSTIKGTEYNSRIGVHLVLTEGRPLTKRMKECNTFCTDGFFHYNFSRYQKLSKDEQRTVYEELTEQIKMIRSYGAQIHHIDSHHHIHNAPNIFPIVVRIAKEQKIGAIRIFRNIGSIDYSKRLIKGVYNTLIRQLGMRYTDLFGSREDYIKCGERLRPESKLEIMVHPDYSEEGCLIDRAGDAPYDNPFGPSLDSLMEVIHERTDTILERTDTIL